MSKTGRNILIYVIVICVVAAGCFFGGRASVKPEIKIVSKTEIKWKDRIVYRDYQSMDCTALQQELLKYDTGEPRLDGIMKGDTFHATAGLNDRDWERDFKLKASAGDSWKWYLALSIISFVGGACAGGAVDYTVNKK